MDVTESHRIEELRRQVQKDPSSIAFAQLAEEYRRAGGYEEAVSVCRAGLARHPAYLSARVTLGRALMELDRYDEARTELEAVINLAPDNLAAIRALAEIHQRRGELGETLKRYSAALDVARDTPVREPAPRAIEPEALSSSEPEPIDSTPVETDLSASADVGSRGAPTSQRWLGGPLSPSTPAGEQVGPAQPLEAVDALDALTLDLPPLPPPAASWSFDVPPFDCAADVNLDLPGDDPSPDLPPRDEWTSVLQELEEQEPVREPEPVPGPALQELEQWLAAIVDDRSNQR